MSLSSPNLVLKARRIPGELMVFSLYRNPEEEVGSNAVEIPCLCLEGPRIKGVYYHTLLPRPFF